MVLKMQKKILNHEIWLGMTSKMAEASIGYPDNINKSTYKFGTHEQWVYKNKYLYFENNKLTNWQESK